MSYTRKMSYRAMMQRMAYIDRRLRYARDFPSANEIAEGLLSDYGEEPSTRTIQRDIEKMRESGAPIEYDPHRHGYYYTDENWQLSAITLTKGDLLAIMVADRALASYKNSPFYDHLRDVFGRLTELLPENVTLASEHILPNVTVIPDAVTEIEDAVWGGIRAGLNERRSVVIHYVGPGYENSVVRIVDPLHLVGYKGEWYMLCWSHHHEQIRIYALNRIQKAKVRNESFTPPPNFKPEDYIDPSFGVFVNESAAQVAVRFDASVASTIAERQWHPRQTIETHEDGSITLRFLTNQQTQLLFWVSQWGPAAEIVEPPELRERAAEWFQGTAKRYS